MTIFLKDHGQFLVIFSWLKSLLGASLKDYRKDFRIDKLFLRRNQNIIFEFFQQKGLPRISKALGA